MIKINEVYDSAAIAVVVNNDKSNAIPYLGQAFWPNERKASIDLKWIKTANGLPVSLAPSNFDAKSTIRARKGFGINKQEMAFFRESMVISEHDRIELAKLSDCNSPFVKDVVANIFNDTKTLVDGADVVPERMRMQLLFPETGGPSIYIAADGVVYQYNYDVDGKWANKNRKTLADGRLWANKSTAQPLEDIREIIENADEPIRYLIMSQAELNLFMACDSVKEALLAQNTTAHVMMTADVAKKLISNIFPGVEVLVYKKKFKDESGVTHAFVPDGFIAFLPDGKLGNTWFGMTPEELAKMEAQDIDITILPSGVAVVVMTAYDTTMQTTTTVAETLLPSYERMDSVYLLCTGTVNGTTGNGSGGSGASYSDSVGLGGLSVTAEAGTEAGTAKVSVTPAPGAGNSYKYKVGDTASAVTAGQNVKTWSAWDGSADITAETGKVITVVECDSEYKAVKAGSAAVTANA